jgi:hypothetical protein
VSAVSLANAGSSASAGDKHAHLFMSMLPRVANTPINVCHAAIASQDFRFSTSQAAPTRDDAAARTVRARGYRMLMGNVAASYEDVPPLLFDMSNVPSTTVS